MADEKRQGGELFSPGELRNASVAIYCVVERDAADDIAKRFRWAADTIEALRQRVKTLESDNEALTKHLDDCVQERLEEINAEAEAYDRDATNTLAKICETCPAFDWSDYPEGLTTQDAYDFLMEDRTAQEHEVNRLKQRVGELETVIRDLNSALDVMWNDPNRPRPNNLGEHHVDAISAAQVRCGQVLHQEPGDGFDAKANLERVVSSIVEREPHDPELLKVAEAAIERIRARLEEPGEGGGNPMDDLAHMSATARALQVGADQPEQAQEGECPHGCKDGYLDSYPMGRLSRALCPIHGAKHE